MKFNLTIEMDKNVFGETARAQADELSTILENLAAHIGWRGFKHTAPISDSFGNTVGSYSFAERPQ